MVFVRFCQCWINLVFRRMRIPCFIRIYHDSRAEYETFFFVLRQNCKSQLKINALTSKISFVNLYLERITSCISQTFFFCSLFCFANEYAICCGTNSICLYVNLKLVFIAYAVFTRRNQQNIMGNFLSRSTMK